MEVLADLFSLMASPVVELSQLLDAILDHALDLTSSDVGGAIQLRSLNSCQPLFRLKAVGGKLRRPQGRLAPESASPANKPRTAPAAEDRSPYFYNQNCAESDSGDSFFRESRSILSLPLGVRARPNLGKLQVEARTPRAYSESQVRTLIDLIRYAGLLIERHLLKEHACAAGFDIHPVGMSQKFLGLESLVKRIASDPSSPVLIRGERGSGKDMAAYATHYFSSRRDKPFVAANSAALTDGLAADELFGHEKGAFTGAEMIRKGLFQSAHGGSLFLDEIGDMDPHVQAFLLRVLDHGELRQIGSDRSLNVDVRIIAATNQNLEKLISEGKFRSDLYDRLNVLQLRVPPLRERKEDLRLLADFFLRRACFNNGRYRWMTDQAGCRGCRKGRETCAHPALHKALAGHDYPGNVRELRNLMFRLAATVDDEELCPAHLCFDKDISENKHTRKFDPKLDSIIREHIRTVLEKTGGNKSAAARLLGLPLTTMVNKMKRLGIG